MKESNTVISKQKDALDKAKEQANVKTKILELEDRHTQERKESQRQFDEYKQRVRDKEQQMEKEYQTKVADMKLEVLDAKKKFEARVEEFRRQMDDFRKNNDAMEELKKQH